MVGDEGEDGYDGGDGEDIIVAGLQKLYNVSISDFKLATINRAFSQNETSRTFKPIFDYDFEINTNSTTAWVDAVEKVVNDLQVTVHNTFSGDPEFGTKVYTWKNHRGRFDIATYAELKVKHYNPEDSVDFGDIEGLTLDSRIIALSLIHI